MQFKLLQMQTKEQAENVQIKKNEHKQTKEIKHVSSKYKEIKQSAYEIILIF